MGNYFDYYSDYTRRIKDSIDVGDVVFIGQGMYHAGEPIPKINPKRRYLFIRVDGSFSWISGRIIQDLWKVETRFELIQKLEHAKKEAFNKLAHFVKMVRLYERFFRVEIINYEHYHEKNKDHPVKIELYRQVALLSSVFCESYPWTMTGTWNGLYDESTKALLALHLRNIFRRDEFLNHIAYNNLEGLIDFLISKGVKPLNWDEGASNE